MPAKIGDASVVTGDLLRDDADGFEGTVTAVSRDGRVELTMHSGEVRRLPAGKLHFNPWDPKAADSGKEPPALEPTVMNDDPDYQPEVIIPEDV